MASASTAFTKVEQSAVTSTPHEHVEFNWTVQNFRALVQIATASDNDDDNVIIATLPFNLVNLVLPAYFS